MNKPKEYTNIAKIEVKVKQKLVEKQQVVDTAATEEANGE